MTEVTYITDLNSIPFPARNALASCHGNFKKPDCHSIVTSRGCPFDCAFCANKSIWGTHVRERSLDNVFAELDEIISKDRRSFLLIRDDNFICKEEKLSLFCKRLQNTFPKLKWACHARADALNLTLLKEMERAGCMSIQVGVESGDDQILAKCQKNVTTRQLQKLANDFSKVSIDFWATFILGHLDETEASIRKTISFAQELKPTYVSFLFMIPFPGTTYYDELSTQGRIEFDDWAQWDFCAKGPVYETEYLSKKRLIALKKLAFRRYYLNPFNLVRFVYALFRRWKNAAIKF